MSVNDTEIEILSTLVELGHTDAATRLAQGLSARGKAPEEDNTDDVVASPSIGDEDSVVAPVEAAVENSVVAPVEAAAKEAMGVRKQRVSPKEAKDMKRTLRDMRRKSPRGFADSRGKKLGLLPGQTVYFRDRPYLVYDMDAEASAPKGVLAVLVAPDYSHLLRFVQIPDIELEQESAVPAEEAYYENWASAEESEIEEDLSPEQLTAMIDEGKVDEVLEALTQTKKEASPEHDALKLRGAIIDREKKLQEMLTRTGISTPKGFPAEEEVMENPKKYVAKMKKVQALLEEIAQAHNTYFKFSF